MSLNDLLSVLCCCAIHVLPCLLMSSYSLFSVASSLLSPYLVPSSYTHLLLLAHALLSSTWTCIFVPLILIFIVSILLLPLLQYVSILSWAILVSSYLLSPICVDLSLLTPPHSSLFVSFSSMTRPPPCPLFTFLLLTCHMWSPTRCLHHVVSSNSCISRRGESSLIGGVSADRLTNSLFINGLSVPGSQRSQRTIQFSSIDFMSPCRAIFITGIKTLIKDKKRHHSPINSACTTELSLYVVYLPAPWLVCSYY